MNQYVIEHPKHGILSDLSKLEWGADFNDEGGYYNGAQVMDADLASRVERTIPGCRKIRVRYVSMLMPMLEDPAEKPDWSAGWSGNPSKVD